MNRHLFGSSGTVLLWILLLAADTGAQLAFKLGSASLAEAAPGAHWFAAAAGSPFIWLGLACYVCSFVLWMSILRTTPLSLAFSLSGLGYVSILLAARVILGEQISALRWLGVGVIVAGVTLLASEEE